MLSASFSADAVFGLANAVGDGAVTIRPPRRSGTGDRAQARLIKQKIIEKEQELEEEEALLQLQGDLSGLQEFFSESVKTEFSNLDGLSWETPSAQQLLLRWHAEQVVQQRRSPQSRDDVHARRPLPSRLIAPILNSPSMRMPTPFSSPRARHDEGDGDDELKTIRGITPALQDEALPPCPSYEAALSEDARDASIGGEAADYPRPPGLSVRSHAERMSSADDERADRHLLVERRGHLYFRPASSGRHTPAPGDATANPADGLPRTRHPRLANGHPRQEIFVPLRRQPGRLATVVSTSASAPNILLDTPSSSDLASLDARSRHRILARTVLLRKRPERTNVDDPRTASPGSFPPQETVRSPSARPTEGPPEIPRLLDPASVLESTSAGVNVGAPSPPQSKQSPTRRLAVPSKFRGAVGSSVRKQEDGITPPCSHAIESGCDDDEELGESEQHVNG